MSTLMEQFKGRQVEMITDIRTDDDGGPMSIRGYIVAEDADMIYVGKTEKEAMISVRRSNVALIASAPISDAGDDEEAEAIGDVDPNTFN